MRCRRSRRTSNEQLRLFPPTPPVHWTNLPVESRERVLALLARLLSQHARARHTSEVRDE